MSTFWGRVGRGLDAIAVAAHGAVFPFTIGET